MLIPKITIRRVLIAMVFFGLFFAVASSAIRGQQWAQAIVFGVSSLLLMFGLYALTYWFCSVIVAFVPNRPSKHDRLGPFATNRLPPQLIQPNKSESE